MKLVIFDEKDTVLSVYEGEDIVINDDEINIDGNILKGIRENYIVVNDEDTKAEVGKQLPSEVKNKDKKHDLHKKKPAELLQEDVAQLKSESATQLTAIADIYEMILGTGGTN